MDYYIISSTSCLLFYFYYVFAPCINTMHGWLLLLCMSSWFFSVFIVLFFIGWTVLIVIYCDVFCAVWSIDHKVVLNLT